MDLHGFHMDFIPASKNPKGQAHPTKECRLRMCLGFCSTKAPMTCLEILGKWPEAFLPLTGGANCTKKNQQSNTYPVEPHAMTRHGVLCDFTLVEALWAVVAQALWAVAGQPSYLLFRPG